MDAKQISISVSASIGSVSAEVLSGEAMKFLYIFAHGAGAGMTHPFMARLSGALLEHDIGTLRYNFPYMQAGKKRPDPPAIAALTVKRAIDKGLELFPDTPLLAGGKSFGGRMTSQLAAKDPLPVTGLIFVGFPLHAAGNPGVDRAKHLALIDVPTLFLQGTRGALAELGLMQKVCAGLAAATLKTFDGADHSFKAGKADLIPLLAESVNQWASSLKR